MLGSQKLEREGRNGKTKDAKEMKSGINNTRRCKTKNMQELQDSIFFVSVVLRYT